MRSGQQGQLAALTVGVSDRPLRVTSGAHSATLRHFDSKLRPKPKTGPLIPCERRLTEMEISEIQEVTFETHLETGTMTGLIDTFW